MRHWGRPSGWRLVIETPLYPAEGPSFCTNDDDCSLGQLVHGAVDAFWQGRLEGSLAAAQEAVEREIGCSTACKVYGAARVALLLSYVRETDAARRILDALPGDEDPQLALTKALIRSRAALADGHHADAVTIAEQAVDRVGYTGRTDWAPLGNYILGLAAVRQGHMSRAASFTQRLRNDAVFIRETFPTAQAGWLITQVAELEKGPAEAAQLAGELLLSDDITVRMLITEPAAVPWLVRLVRSQGGDESPLMRAEYVARRLSERNPHLRSVRAASLHTAGLLDRDADRLRLAVSAHQDAWSSASAAEDAGRLLAKHGEEAAAATCLDRAMNAYADGGAMHDCSRVKRLMRTISAGSVTRDVGRLRSGVPQLTDTEYAVARIVAEGFTNGQAAEQLYLSRHTVAFHLRKIFRKLGVESRVQLARIWPELDVMPPS